MKWEILGHYDALSQRAASILLSSIRRDPHLVLGLPTGRTPVGMYAQVVADCAREYHCFRDVTTFNLDEYAGITGEHPASYCAFMKQHLFNHVDVRPENTHIPNGNASDLAAECARYDSAITRAGGLALTFLGLGSNGHIAFNEPGTPFDSRTRVVALTDSTRKANASFFPDGNVPTHAITMGIGTILDSHQIVLLASGPTKREAVARLRSGEVTADFPASALWKHDDVHVLVTADSESRSAERG
ncbi:MAG: glucosamine-6-phosphate deaminase [Thermoanaerobaculia bacterium]|nr:glucosamine-6-phosphate deaminase [Thermoanaerobaculia bacterium]